MTAENEASGIEASSSVQDFTSQYYILLFDRLASFVYII